MKTKVTALAFLSVLFVFVLSAFTSQPQDKKVGGPWEIPDEYKTKANPYADDESLVDVGKMIYMKQCRSCHGNKGLGDGPKARGLETDAGDFTNAKWAEMTDGEWFYMSIIGRDEMPNFEAKIPDDEDRWALIMYIKTLK